VAALSKGITDVAESLLAAGGTAPSKEGGLVLMLVAGRGNEVAVDILLKAKADINAQNDRGLTPLIAAVCGRHPHIVEKLIAAGADTVSDRKRLLGLCRKHNIDPAVIGVVTGKDSGEEKVDSKADKKETSAVVDSKAGKKPKAGKKKTSAKADSKADKKEASAEVDSTASDKKTSTEADAKDSKKTRSNLFSKLFN
jgi:ankyrin repeat protein